MAQRAGIRSFEPANPKRPCAGACPYPTIPPPLFPSCKGRRWAARCDGSGHAILCSPYSILGRPAAAQTRGRLRGSGRLAHFSCALRTLRTSERFRAGARSKRQVTPRPGGASVRPVSCAGRRRFISRRREPIDEVAKHAQSIGIRIGADLPGSARLLRLHRLPLPPATRRGQIVQDAGEFHHKEDQRQRHNDYRQHPRRPIRPTPAAAATHVARRSLVELHGPGRIRTCAQPVMSRPL